ncbi:ANK REP REGION domain-containing protein [Citrus sinensis]|uniref:ANK REP REGION domain-containing protein n=1 Tax=Citrus sinensis TaxID=2711 RepID=A0ACB8MS89_CITSI|nr:ANK REP REGION domain-containing protein [Citrus sinensis]
MSIVFDSCKLQLLRVKLTIAGKDIVKEEDFEELTSDSLKDYDVSSISGSEDEADKLSCRHDPRGESVPSVRTKLFIRLQSGERVSFWKCLMLNESESVSYEDDKSFSVNDEGCLSVSEGCTHLRVVFACKWWPLCCSVFDGNLVVARKTFHRSVHFFIKDASGKAANSAGAALRRYNELALKKDLQELLASWKPYFDASICVFIYAPSTNRQLLFNGDKSYFSHQCCTIQNIPLAVRRPTLKETQRVYRQLTQVAYEVDEKDISLETCESSRINSISNCDPGSSKEDLADKLDLKETFEASSSCKQYSEQCLSSESESEVTGITTSLHEAAQSSIAQKVLELLEQGLDPCIKDENGRTPYMLASEKEVRNTFRRFMASNPDKWDWHAAKVPSALTKEMEESQAAKQAEKDAKRKARAKELKKLRKAREKRAAQAQAAENAAVADNQSTPSSVLKGEAQLRGLHISKEEELKRSQAAEREKRAAAAERRMAAALALNAQGSSTSVAPSTLQPKTGLATDINCSCCGASLAGKVPFHRYNYKYCSTSCMHVHREVLEDG